MVKSKALAQEGIIQKKLQLNLMPCPEDQTGDFANLDALSVKLRAATKSPNFNRSFTGGTARTSAGRIFQTAANPPKPTGCLLEMVN